ncbi:MAG TPA: hypothetical protein VE777_04005 [Gaiellales bacterium]|jgi:hypothetical protein|nr:hypothetical protein [Gaiellales bacterium]
MRARRPLAALAAAAAASAALAGPAWALAPSHANITFVPGSTVTPTSTGVIASAALVWTPGASDTGGVGCCMSDISDATTGDKLLEGTPLSRYPFTWDSGASLRFQIDSYDANGSYVGTAFTNAPSFVSNLDVAPETDATYTGTWTTQANSNALGGSLRYSTAKGAGATFSASVRTLAWLTTVGPTHGSARIYIGNTLVKTVSTYAGHVGYRRIKFVRAWWGGPNDPVRTIRIVNAGTSGHSRVDVDGFVNASED